MTISKERLDELEAELDQTKVERNLMPEGMARDAEQIRKLQAERDALRADNERLREALESSVAWYKQQAAPVRHAGGLLAERWHKALAATPADSLREYRNGVLEAAEEVVGAAISQKRQELGTYENGFPEEMLAALEAIRAMKETDNGPD